MASTDYWMLEDDKGRYLRGDQPASTADRAGDNCMWRLDGTRLRAAVGATTYTIDIVGDAPCGQRVRLLADERVTASTCTLRPGPTRLPSEHLAELRTSGFTVLERLLDAAAVARVRQEALRQLTLRSPDAVPTDGRLNIPDGLAWSVDVARAVTHPVALWLMREFLGTGHIHYCHAPSVTTMCPASKLRDTRPPGGWHSDYPYHPGVFPDDHWPTERVFGVQFNVCVDAFRTDNAATQYLPGSHLLCRWPPREFNAVGTQMGEGVHRDVRQMEAPAGSALIYDARTWHRACDELNVSGENRVAVLNAVAPAWVLPMVDKRKGADVYLASAVPEQLTERERADIERLCNAATATAPVDVPQLQRRRA